MKRIVSALLVGVLLTTTVAAQQDIEGWQEEMDRIDAELDEREARATRSGIFAGAGFVVFVAGLVLAGNGYDENENIKSWPMVIGGFSTAGVGTGVSLGFGISLFQQKHEMETLGREKDGYAQNIREKQREIRKAEREQELRERFGHRAATAIMNDEIYIGMPAEAVIESWGEPDDVNRTITAETTKEQWVYDRRGSDREYVYVENNVVTTIQE